MKTKILTLLALLTLTINLFAESINITDTDGNAYTVEATNSQLKISGMEGKVVFLEFFGLRCPACREEMPTLINLQSKYSDRMQILAVEVQQNEVDPINQYKQQHNINYPTFSNYDIGLLVRFIADKSGWDGKIPFMVGIDKNGYVRFTQAGLISEEILAQKMNEYSQ
jgi:thiol-disulfide isomerase/thioredoxin